jgi:hypothetical protein
MKDKHNNNNATTGHFIEETIQSIRIKHTCLGMYNNRRWSGQIIPRMLLLINSMLKLYYDLNLIEGRM